MRVLVAGGTGVVGRLVPRLVERSHAVTATTTTAARTGMLQGLGAEPIMVLGAGGGVDRTSWVHLDDATSATVLAVEQHAEGLVDVGRAFSNVEAKRELGWRQGLRDALS